MKSLLCPFEWSMIRLLFRTKFFNLRLSGCVAYSMNFYHFLLVGMKHLLATIAGYTDYCEMQLTLLSKRIKDIACISLKCKALMQKCLMLA